MSEAKEAVEITINNPTSPEAIHLLELLRSHGYGKVIASKLTTAPLPDVNMPHDQVSMGWCDDCGVHHSGTCADELAKTSAAPVGEREGEFEKWCECEHSAKDECKCLECGLPYITDVVCVNCGRTKERHSDEGEFLLCHPGDKPSSVTVWRAALASKPYPAPEGIPERPKVRSADIGCISDDHRTNANVYLAKDADPVFDALEALLSAKDAELIQIKLELRDFQGQVPGLRGAWKFEYDRAEAAEAKLTSLRASRARIEEETLRKAARLCADQEDFNHQRIAVHESEQNPEGITRHTYSSHIARTLKDAILALLPTSPEKEQTGEEG